MKKWGWAIIYLNFTTYFSPNIGIDPPFTSLSQIDIFLIRVQYGSNIC